MKGTVFQIMHSDVTVPQDQNFYNEPSPNVIQINQGG